MSKSFQVKNEIKNTDEFFNSEYSKSEENTTDNSKLELMFSSINLNEAEENQPLIKAYNEKINAFIEAGNENLKENMPTQKKMLQIM